MHQDPAVAELAFNSFDETVNVALSINWCNIGSCFSLLSVPPLLISSNFSVC